MTSAAMIDVISARVHLTLYRAHLLGYVYVSFIINNLYLTYNTVYVCVAVLAGARKIY
jgi:hypothetical protein